MHLWVNYSYVRQAHTDSCLYMEIQILPQLLHVDLELV